MGGAADGPTPASRRRRWLRRLLWIGGSFVGLVLLYALAVVGLGLIPVHRDWRPAVHGIPIWIWSNGVHIDFVLPVDAAGHDWRGFVPPPEEPSGSFRPEYVSFGWGDRGFYLFTPRWKDLTVGTALSAVLWPTPSVMHVEYREWPPLPSDRCRELLLSDEQYQHLASYIEGGFALRDGRPQRIAGQAYGVRDAFYEARGSYHLFYTCNSWANDGLKAIGVRTALWAPFDLAIFHHLDRR